MPINRLDAVTIGHIAAGEVIERPVSVIKECVENSLDAGATRISISIRGGGLEEIEIVDNGHGIGADELPLALERHATSKLRDAQGLEALATLGFRGEGLASIASVAKVRLRSRRAQDECAAEVEAFEERISQVVPAAGPIGTAVTARELFANVPVRREYLRSAQAEATRVSTFITTLALGYPDVAFIVHTDGKEVVNLPPAANGFDRIAHVFGRDAYGRMLEISELATGMHGSIRGFISRPGESRGDRRQQLLFVNGRLLRSTQLAGAWTAAYVGYTLTGRHAFGVLLIDLPPDHLDPNVHPTKSDVRFRYGAQLVGTVKRALVTTLQRDAQTRLQASISFAPPPAEPGIFTEYTSVSRFPADQSERAAAHDFYDKDTAHTDLPRERVEDSASDGDAADRSTYVMPPAASSDPAPPDQLTADIAGGAASASWQNTRRAANQADARLMPLLQAPVERLRVLAQLDRAFILATDGRAIVLVDQHAAHERIAYEAIANAALATDDAVRIAQQPLLVPELFECSHSDAAALDASLDALQQAGVELEAFGERVYRLTAMPAILAARHFNIRGYLDDLDEETPDLDARERVWATMACHSVVRAGETMQHDEMQVVVDRLALCANPMHCPHGRPTIVRLEAPAIARMFRRV